MAQVANARASAKLKNRTKYLLYKYTQIILINKKPGVDTPGCGWAHPK